MNNLTIGSRYRVILFLVVLSFICSFPGWGANIGFYTGTFDPLHAGHLQVALRSIERIPLDRIYLLPNFVPSHKPGATPFFHRYRFVKMISYRYPKIQTLDERLYEQAYQEDPENSVSLLIQRIMKKEGLENRFFHVCGTDSYQKMKEYGKLPGEGDPRVIVVVDRKGYETEFDPETQKMIVAGRLRMVDFKIPELSSTLVRRQIQSGVKPGPDLLPACVYYHIQRYHLYGYKP